MNKRLLAVLGVVLAVAGCGKSDNTDKAAGAQSAARATVVPGADAVAAVLQSAGTPIAKVGFVVLTKPVVGVQSALRLDLTAPEPAVVPEGDGLVVDPASARADVSLVTAGATVNHELKFTPQREGLSEVTVRLHSGDSGTPETTYVIPVLATKAAAGG